MRRLATVVVLLVPGLAAARDDQELSLADLAAYRAALDGRPGGEAVPVTFRALWERPEQYQGRRVRVEGRLVRRFRQGAFGTFPPLVEAWAVSPAGDPLCLVYPDPAPTADPPAGASVGFEGVFLRQVKYTGGDTARLAPLIVGDHAPTSEAATTGRPPQAPAWTGFSTVDWTLGAGAALLVVGVFLAQYLRRTPRRSPPGSGPPPEFTGPP